MFSDRTDASIQLAERLAKFKDGEAILLAIPRGGVSIAYESARRHGIPMDVIIIKKIGHPNNPEFAVGAISMDSSFIHPVHRRGIPPEYIEEMTRVKQEEARERYRMFRGDRQPLDLQGRTAILVDDGVATGATMLMAVEVVRNMGAARVVVAVPVAPPDTVRRLEEVADEVICLLKPLNFMAIGQFYSDFTQVPTEEAKRLLEDR